MKIALIFWGLTRSLKYTIDSIQKNIFNVLKESNIDYDIYLHTYNVENLYNNRRANESNIKLNFEEYKLLNPDYFLFDDLKIVKKELNLSNYRTKNDPWESNYECVDNFILALYSKYKITKLLESKFSNNINNDSNIYSRTISKNNDKINNLKNELNNIKIVNENENEINKNILEKKSKQIKENILDLEELNKDLVNDSIILEDNKTYDAVIFLRPDMKYINKLDINILKNIDNNNVYIPNFCIFNNFNDRFFISNIKNGLKYGLLFDELLEYSKFKELHSETFHYDKIVKEYKLKVNLTNFYFNRFRANGKELSNDYKHRRLKVNYIN